jgi:hypothetical protein
VGGWVGWVLDQVKLRLTSPAGLRTWAKLGSIINVFENIRKLLIKFKSFLVKFKDHLIVA